MPSNVLATVCFSRYMNTLRTRSMGGSAEWAAVGHVRHSFRTVCAEARMPTGNKSHSCAWCHQTDVAHVWSDCVTLVLLVCGVELTIVLLLGD